MPRTSRPRTHRELTAADLAPHVEAALFATNKPLNLDELCELLDEGKRKVKSAVELLAADYQGRPRGALEVDESEAGWILAVKGAYTRVTERIVPMELSQATVRTLSLIAAKQPLRQTDLIALRGSSAYDHLKELVEQGLVTKVSEGRSFLLRTTPKFQEYFKVDAEQLAKLLPHLTAEPEA